MRTRTDTYARSYSSLGHEKSKRSISPVRVAERARPKKNGGTQQRKRKTRREGERSPIHPTQTWFPLPSHGPGHPRLFLPFFPPGPQSGRNLRTLSITKIGTFTRVWRLLKNSFTLWGYFSLAIYACSMSDVGTVGLFKKGVGTRDPFLFRSGPPQVCASLGRREKIGKKRERKSGKSFVES